MSVAKCIGIWGRLFGHKFQSRDFFLTHCKRCSMPRGGWRTDD